VVLVYVFARLWPVFSGLQGQIQNIDSCVPAYEKLMEAQTTMGRESAVEQERVDYSAWRELRFDAVRFAYRDSEEETLSGVSFGLRRGEKLALLGRNGAGKTTAVNLLMGFLLPREGSITVDGKPLTSANIASWRRQVGYVPQDPLILNASVRENLKRFHPEATDEDLIAALKKAYAWGFVSKMADGLDTKLGDRGIRLSGGERQRIVLARVLLGRPSMIVLDEATSALDYESETAFHDVIESLGQESAVVLIAHSLATVRMADRAVVLEDGAVVEEGSIEELVASPESYLSGMVHVG
jgi:ATP-binding cassette, subfamily C, bacterial